MPENDDTKPESTEPTAHTGGSGAFDIGTPEPDGEPDGEFAFIAPPENDAEQSPGVQVVAGAEMAAGSQVTRNAGGVASAEILPSSLTTAARPGVPKGAIMGVIVALIVAAGAVTVLKLGGASPPSDIASVVPAEVLGFMSISAEPKGEQRDALRSLVGRLPAQKRTELLGSFDKAIGSLLDGGEDFQTAVKPWLGPQLGFSVLPIAGEPVVIGTIGVRDDEAATAYLSRGGASSGRVFEISDNVAYVAQTKDQIAAFRASAGKATLSSHPAYLKELAAAGGQGLATLWLNGEEIGKNASAISGLFGGLTTLPGLDASAGSAIFVLRAESDGLAFVGHQTGGPKSTTKPGRPRLLEGAPKTVLGALSVFDLKGSFAQIDSATGASNPFAGYDGILGALGLDLQDDVLAWLGGEVTIIATPQLEFGLIADVTDEAAYKKTIDALLPAVAPGLGLTVTKEGSGYTAASKSTSITVRRASKRVAIGVGSSAKGSRALADRLLAGGPDGLAETAAYKAVIGAPSSSTAFQAYVNLGALAPFLANAGGLAALEPFEAAALRVTLTDDGSEFRLVLKLS